MATYRYHWTHKSNLASIAETGLDPIYATKRMPVVWMCSATRIQWAVGHVAYCHGHSPDEMVLLRIRVDGLELTGTQWTDVFHCSRRISPSRICVRPDTLSARFVSLRNRVVS